MMGIGRYLLFFPSYAGAGGEVILPSSKAFCRPPAENFPQKWNFTATGRFRFRLNG